jgi:NADP-dependent 3-hydroxy acid dehydrogenase YdfG
MDFAGRHAACAGRLDLMFNNAGISWGGDTELPALDQRNAIIVIRGVVHGVAAACPQMIRQGHGHIVNTASMAVRTAAGLMQRMAARLVAEQRAGQQAQTVGTG